MATVTDFLITTLQLQGVASYERGMAQAAQSVQQVAAAQAAQTSATAATTAAISANVISYTELAAGLTTVIALAKEAVQTFAQDEQAIFRTTVVLRNLGNTYPIERAQAFASELQKTIAIDDEAVVSLIGLEKRFGIADSQIEGTTRTIIDFSKATGLSLEQAGEVVGRALLGQNRGLRALGVQFTATGNRIKDTAELMRRLNDVFGGAGAAERNTVAGTFTALKESLANLFSAVGDRLSTVILPVLNKIKDVIDWLANHPSIALGVVGANTGGGIGSLFGPVGTIIGGLLGGAAGAAIGGLGGRKNAAAAIGTGKGKLATEDTLSKIERNTAKLPEALIRNVLGGPGTVARGAVTARDFRLAFAI